MSEFQWTPEHSVGVEQIDQEHREIVLAIQGLELSLNAHESDGRIGAALDKAIRTMVGHFESEERLMAQHDYPGLAGQKLDHELCRMNLMSLDSVPRLRGDSYLMAVPALLYGWWEGHTLTADMQLKDFFAGIGVH